MKYLSYTHNMELYFWRRANREKEETGEAMIYLRVEIKGFKRAELSTTVKATSKEWSAAKEKLVVRRLSEEEDEEELEDRQQRIKAKNKKLSNLKRQVEQAYEVQKSQGGDPSPADLKELMRHKEVKRPEEATLLVILEHYRAFLETKGKRPATVRAAVTAARSVATYLQQTHQEDPVGSLVTVMWCRSYERWCQARGLKARTIHDYLSEVFAALQEAVAEGLLARNNAQDYSYLSDVPAPEKRHLSPEEVRCIANHVFDQDTLRRVARLFLFACYTGLSYADYVRVATDPDAFIRWEPAPDGRLVKGYALSRQKMASRQEEQWTPFLQEADALLSELPIVEHSSVNKKLKIIARVLALSLTDLKHKDARSTFAQIQREKFDLATASDLARHSPTTANKHYSSESAASLIKRMMDKGATFIYN